MEPSGDSPSKSGVIAVYGGGLLQGLAVVAFPASSTILRDLHGLSDAAYGSLFLPQTALTVVGSIIGGALAARIGLRPLLVASGVLAALSQGLLLVVGRMEGGSPNALGVLLVATAAVGFGFGLSAAPLNAYPGRLFFAHRDSALVALHALLGTGFALGPLIVSALATAGAWLLFPGLGIGLGVVLTVLAVVARLPRKRVRRETERAAAPLAWQTLGLFAAVAVLYAFAEGSFSNWASVFLHDARGVRESTAALAISGFWGALTAGRLVVSALVTRLSARGIWLALPLAMAAVFLLLPFAAGPLTGVSLFVLAGLSASAFFPLTVAIASRRFAGHEALVSSVLTAALMVGVGGGSFLLGAVRESASFETIYRWSALYPLGAFAMAWVLAFNPRWQNPGTASSRRR